MLRVLRSSASATSQARKAFARSISNGDKLDLVDTFSRRHIGPSSSDAQLMLKSIGFDSFDDLVKSTVPKNILANQTTQMPLSPALTESEALKTLKSLVSQNKVSRSFIGMGYYDTITPPVIARNVLENPGWYTAYTPYQAEISQGRMEMLLNFQTLVSDLTGLSMALSSLLDEATAASEAMQMCFALKGKDKKVPGGNRDWFFISEDLHPQTIGLLETRAEAIGLNVKIGSHSNMDLSEHNYCGVIVQYPNTYGSIQSPGESYRSLTERLHENGALLIAATDLMALSKIESPGSWGADIAVGSAQRFGVPMGFGGPHAGFLSTSDAYSRKLPGRIIGVTIDSAGKPALRMAMQTREQHIRRDKATSNICTAQALLANMAAAYAVYHGPEGVKDIAGRIHALARVAHRELGRAGFECTEDEFFDTFVVHVGKNGKGMTSQQVQDAAARVNCNVRIIDAGRVGISMGESISRDDLRALLSAFGVSDPDLSANDDDDLTTVPKHARTGDIMVHPIFRSIKSETMMLRYLKKLENRDLALNTSMISLGSCTMKLNATSEMVPVSWPEVSDMHPFAPHDQVQGYHALIRDLNRDLCVITGFDAVSAQPNSGANGEYAGLLAIKGYLQSVDQGHRDVVLIPRSAHGTNPASAAMAGLRVVVVDNDEKGNCDMADLRAKIAKHGPNVAALMITYPSTFGVFEEGIKDICELVHQVGGQVYMDGANMNAQVGLTSPGSIGADVCHLNLHKTFCIPHGGGGPGVGSIGVRGHLAPFLPGHVVDPSASGELCGAVLPKITAPRAAGAVSAAPFGSAGILPISWMYIKMMGPDGLRSATQHAILNANYMASRLSGAYDVLYTGQNGQVAHEYVLDLRALKAATKVSEEDVAKRLQDYGFHSPTMSWPVGGTLMVEPTESEDLGELNRFCDAMLAIRQEIDDIGSGKMKYEDSPLKHAPHTVAAILDPNWSRPYTREVGVYPAPWVKSNKFWPTIGRVDNVYGDRNLMCTCPPIEAYEEDVEVKAL